MHSLEELYERYSGAVFDYLHRMSGDRHLAEDLTGETFYRAMLSIDGFRGEASVKTWLLRIARNLFLRRMEREKRTSSFEALEERGVPLAARGPDPETKVMQDEHGEAVRRALLSLPEIDRSILLLSAHEKLRCRDIADVLNVSVTAAKVRLYRARRRLAEALEREGAWPAKTDDEKQR